MYALCQKFDVRFKLDPFVTTVWYLVAVDNSFTLKISELLGCHPLIGDSIALMLFPRSLANFFSSMLYLNCTKIIISPLLTLR